MLSLLKKVYPLRLAPVSEDTDKAIEILCKELPFTIHEYKSKSEHNGWIVPDKWKAVKAEIWKDEKLIYDGMRHPLGVVGYSTSFKGKLSLEELKKHLFYHPELPEALVYHCDYYYKPWKKDWGFSVPYNLYNQLEEGEYEIILETIFENGTMKVLDFVLKGDKSDIIILNAHNCHAAQANDDISGVVAGIEVIKRLRDRKKRRYSYRIIIAPEHLGTVFYLANTSAKAVKNFKYAIFLEMLGNKNRFSLQESFTGDTLIDQAARHYLRHNFNDSSIGPFRKIVGNDETVWESPGFEIPCVSLSRALYPEYHSDMDNEKIISEEKLQESVEAILGIINILETNTKMKRHFNGLIALSNPKYNLYIPNIDISIRNGIEEEQIKWNYLMDCLIRYFDNKITVLDIAIKHHLDYIKLYDYIKKMEEKGLISLADK